MLYVIILVIAFMIVAPLFFIGQRVKNGKSAKAPLLAHLISFFGILFISMVYCITQAPSALAATADTVTTTVVSDGLAKGMGYISAALAVGISGIGGGIAVSAAATAALGTISENEKTFGKALIFVGLAEGVALYGLLIGILIVFSL